MAKTFIWVKDMKQGANIIINTNHIVSIKQSSTGNEVALSNGDNFIVNKKFTELLDLLNVDRSTEQP
jgi:hypothetical protein